jgi:PAS domain S-box-containing protein
VVTLGRMSGLYRRQSVVLVVAILLPIMLNLLFNLRVEPFRQVDLTPFAFVLTTAVLVWGVYQFSLLDLRPVARSQIFRTISDPVLVLDPDGRVLDANPAAGRLVGRPPTEIVGEPVTRLLPTWSATVTEALAARVDQASKEVTRDGRIYDLAISALPDRQRQSGGHLVVARDVTERRQVEERLCAALNHERVATDRLAAALAGERAAAEHLRTLDELKSGFLQAVSHDLRTPLASVLGISLTLQRGRGQLGPADTDDLLGRLTANARKLDRILTGLLDLDRLDRGIVELRRERVDLARLVAGVVSEAREELLDGRPVSLELLPVQVVADAAKVERIVENLLANAARHTDPGTPIWVRVTHGERGALLCVDDAGPGVPAEQRESIFRPFERGPGGDSYTPGSGVGLALVAQIASLHDGHAWVEDRAGGGASFRVLLPEPNGDR